MPQTLNRWTWLILSILSLWILYTIFANLNSLQLTITYTDVQNFKTVFLSIVLEAIPFILIGVLVSSLLQEFVPDRWIRKMIPNSPFVGVLVGGLMGILFPLCECGMIPVVRRLVQKGLPLYIGIVYILAGPIVNPVVFGSTALAFRQVPEILWLRMALGFMVAIIVGLIAARWMRTNPLRSARVNDAAYLHPHHEAQQYTTNTYRSSRLAKAVGHMSEEFFEMGKYLLIGCLLTAVFQVFVSREFWITIGEGMSSHLFMAGFAYLLSICSTSDAFIASSFIGTFSTGSLLTFLVFGPMLDLKNTIVLLSVFRTRFVAILSAVVLFLVLLGSMLAEYLFL
ncbi:permease [Marinicrinis lubricantis]|uniref:Permease n=1 Tax=Marinicrinis lubricantis TaxID=2086470 RepID=A0ABW1IKA1_9BACL